MAGLVDKILGCGCCLLALIIVVVESRGASESVGKETYKPDPRDPIASDTTYALEGHVGLDLTKDPYGDWDLAYYHTYYDQYYRFMFMPEHRNTKKLLMNSTLDVCVNYYIYTTNTTLGRFTCPMPFEPDSFRKCCGFDHAEFCCYGDNTGIVGSGIGVFVGICVFILAFGVLVFLILGWKTQGSRRSSKFSNDDY